MKKKINIDRILGDSNQVLLNDDDDEYLIEVVKDEEEADSYLEREKKKLAGKELKSIDHANQNYDKIKKNLYIETKEITRMTDKEVSEFRKLNGDIKVRGLKCPKPIMNWY